MNKRAFTLVEYMIVLVITGLLLAMALPAYHTVKMAGIGQAIKRGDKSITREQKQDYLEWAEIRNGLTEPTSKKVAKELDESRESVSPDVSNPSLQTIRIKDKTYYLIPKQDLTETTIAGETYYLVPSQ